MAVDRREQKPDDAKNRDTTNDRTDLEVWLRIKGPEFLRRHAANIALVVALLLALGFFLFSRNQNRRLETAAVHDHVAAAYDYSLQLRQSFLSGGTGDLANADRQERARNTITSADFVGASDLATPAQKAIALLAKADVYWALANAPTSALATTRPVAGFEVRAATENLTDAEAAYTAILRDYPNESEPAAAALLSLAAIAENRGAFDDAAKWYRNVIDAKQFRPIYHEIASARLAMVDGLRKPVVLATPATRATQPAETPVMLRPPTTAPAATTSPATSPAAN